MKSKNIKENSSKTSVIEENSSKTSVIGETNSPKTRVINEGKAKIKIFEPNENKDVSKELEVFYNPVMKLNRDLSVLLLNSIEKEELQIADPLAGSGVRAVRFLTELKENKIKSININDYSKDAVSLIKENIKLNEENLNCDNIEVSQLDANQFLNDSLGFDYIDIDPFGSPNFLLDVGVRRISRAGILAVTATDTSALSGTYPNAGMRKYWAKTIRQEHKHEAGIRILIRKCQLIGTQHEKALIPILSYSKDHYFRIFFHVEKGKEKCDKILKEHKFFHYCSVCAKHEISMKNYSICCDKETQTAGPLWSGNLFDPKLISKINKLNSEEKNSSKNINKFLETLLEESKLSTPFFYDIHSICKKHKFALPRTNDLTEKIVSKGFKVSRTHFLDTAIKTDISFEELMSLIKIN